MEEDKGNKGGPENAYIDPAGPDWLADAALGAGDPDKPGFRGDDEELWDTGWEGRRDQVLRAKAITEMPSGAYRPEAGTHLVRLLRSGGIAYLIAVNHRADPYTYARIDTVREFDAVAGDYLVDWYAAPLLND
ncbi:MAG TPA: hypothetical protein VHQ86_04020 [Candidatus Saccharimonadia bacterium]|jgi:hypothetical protein|nr:hypothetical protein [Candidatus Saccharimonadia bacterium]